MNNLFRDDETVSALGISDYINWISNSERYSYVLALPPIQRGFIWKPKQIQNLWDSLLRSMPIGSVMLQKFKKDTEVYDELSSSRKVEKSQKSGYFLMDGQQRSLAILLGFKNTLDASHRLWIDFGSDGVDGCLFQFRITTKSQPFGYNQYGNKLSLSERRDAYDHYKYSVDCEIDFNETIPWKASDKDGKYIYEVKTLWENIELLDEWKHKNFPFFNDLKDEAKEKIEKFYLGLLSLVKQQIPLILIPNFIQDGKLKNPNHDSLTMLFERISLGGTRLNSDDLLFSMIKQAWPEAHNIVFDLQKKVGSLMRPTDYVLTAFRISALLHKGKSHISDEPRPDARFFHRHLFELLGKESEKGILMKLISSEEEGLQVAFKSLIKVIEYDTEENYGLPKAMFPHLDVSLVQIFLYWIVKNNIKHINQSRDDIIRFILFWKLSCPGRGAGDKGSKVIIEYLKENDLPLFPAKELYEKLIEKNADGDSLFISLLSVENIDLDIHISELQTPKERAKKYFHEENIDLYNSFVKNKYLLLWLQRVYIEKQFQNFNPISGQNEDSVPYDFDHLVPQSNWSSKHSLERNFINEKNKKSFENLWIRRSLGNSIGNYRVLDASDNRSRGDQPLAEDLKQIYDNESKKYFLKDFCLQEDEKNIERWIKASPNNKNYWHDERLYSFQAGIESRVLFLYKTYMQESKLSDWF